MENNQTIFDLSNPKWIYKGVVSATLDHEEIMPGFPPPKGYIAEVIAIIWVNENSEWILKARMKFPSGNKQSYERNFGKNANETKLLTELYLIPMKNKFWFPNVSGKGEDIIKILENNDMILSKKIVYPSEKK